MTIYLDMDGVIADFFGAVEKKYEARHWKALNMRVVIAEIANTNWFYKLDEFSTSKKLVESVQKISEGDWGICSSPLRQDTFNSAYWKRRWLEDRGWIPWNLDKLIFTSNKSQYARAPFTGEPNILIDDKYSNIDQWNNAGGIGIWYQANECDVNELIKKIEKSLK